MDTMISMPNYCENDISISGSKAQMQAFLESLPNEAFEENEFSILEKWVPLPELSARGEDFDWYAWSVEHWGCKWPDQSSNLEVRPRSVRFFALSPWSPPLAGFLKFSELTGLTVRIRYYEGSNGFCGHAVFENGQVKVSTSANYRGRRGG